MYMFVCVLCLCAFMKSYMYFCMWWVFYLHCMHWLLGLFLSRQASDAVDLSDCLPQVKQRSTFSLNSREGDGWRQTHPVLTHKQTYSWCLSGTWACLWIALLHGKHTHMHESAQQLVQRSVYMTFIVMWLCVQIIFQVFKRSYVIRYVSW